MFTKKRVYLDVAAAAPVHRKAQEAFMKALAAYGNPSAIHEEGRAAKNLLEEARKRIARHTGAKPEHVIFTSGATEANALAIVGLIQKRRKNGTRKMHVLYHPGAHASLTKTVLALKEWGVDVEDIALTSGAVDLSGLAKQIRKETMLVCLEALSPETGMRFDTRGV
ncbi:aminotransferase class V-fold PLP-dependent enzyme, partial [Candidatus Parcubacteria bacterium]|nr:aminotransferase class V-fold PLP-dependent enzyme [Candidatus Parcubacteria bacterium]